MRLPDNSDEFPYRRIVGGRNSLLKVPCFSIAPWGALGEQSSVQSNQPQRLIRKILMHTVLRKSIPHPQAPNILLPKINLPEIRLLFIISSFPLSGSQSYLSHLTQKRSLSSVLSLIVLSFLESKIF